jgi:ligand-binding sensor domain-containing protein
MKFKLFINIALFFAFFKGYSQAPLVRINTFEHEYIGLKVSKIFAGEQGFLWMGTQLGLFQHDGVNVDHYPFPDSILNQKITVIKNDEKKQIWLGTNKGNIYYLNDRVLHKLTSFKNPDATTISSLAFGLNGEIWIGTKGSGLYAIKNERQYQLLEKDGLVSMDINDLELDSKGFVWVGTDNGLSIGSIQKGIPICKPFEKNEFLSDPIITDIVPWKKGALLFGTQSMGIFEMKAGSQELKPFIKSGIWQFGAIVQIVKEQSHVWIATEDSGLLLVENHEITLKLNKQNSIVNNRISGIAEDKEGNLWISDKSEHVVTVNKLFSFIQLPKFSKGGVQSIGSDRNGILWFSDTKQTYAWKDGSYLDLPDKIKNIQSVSIFCDSSGFVWFGTFGKGVFRFEPKTKQLLNFKEENGLQNNNVISISGKGNTIWMATLGGLSCFKNESNLNREGFVSIPKNLQNASFYYYQVYLDSKGIVWLGTDGNGLVAITPDGVKKYGKKDGLNTGIINSICEDNRYNLWFNSPDAGLIKWDGNKFTSFGSKNGIREMGYGSIIADHRDNLILANGKGIDMVNILNGNILYHDKEIGFEEGELVNKVSCNADDGLVYIGAGNRIVIYDPCRNLLWKGPKPIIKKAFLFLDEFDKTPNKVFNSSENNLSFDYIGVWYHMPEEVNYQIKLEGYDREWIKSRNLRITYPQLPAGKYTLRIKALPSNNFVTDEEASYSFEISKPYYQTIWFFVFIGFLLVFFTWLAFYLVTQKKRKEEELYNEKVMFQLDTLRNQVNPHFLFNSFNTLSGIIELNPSDAVAYVEHLSDFFRNILQYKEMDLIPLKDELAILDDYYFIQKKRFRENLNLIVAPELKDSSSYIAPMTLQILVENAIKHNVVSKAHPLEIRIEPFSEYYFLVKNKIQIKSSSEPSTKTGLNNIIRRYELLQALRVLIEKNKDSFIVKIPYIKSNENSNN